MKKSSLTIPHIIISTSIILLSHAQPSHPRPFDWHYSRFATPFALFYNPALLGSNPGPTAAVDARYADSLDCDARVAITYPLGRIMKREDHIWERGSRNRYFSYANPSYMSSRNALSIGGVYANENNYKISAGLTTPVYLIQSGVSVDVAYKGDATIASVNLGFCANTTRKGDIVYFALSNLIPGTSGDKSVRDSTTDFGIAIGSSGSPFSDQSRIFLPYDILFTYYPNGTSPGGKRGSRLEGLARLNLDLAYLYTNRGESGQVAVSSLGYGFVRRENGDVDHRIFASVGVEFINRRSSASGAFGYGSSGGRGETQAAFMYSKVNKTGVAEDPNIASHLRCVSADSGRVVFGLNTGGVSINSWVLKIETHGGGNVKTFSGGNVVPSSIAWDGLDSEGNALEDDIVYATLVLRGERRVVESAKVGVEIIDGRPNAAK